MPLQDVANSLGIPLGTAKSRLHYALTAMRTGVQAEAHQAPATIPRGQPA
jgi:DNA-directed RNA polymerase specialized sigma24 family protein